MKLVRRDGGHGPQNIRDMMNRFFDDSMWDPFSSFDFGMRMSIPRMDVYETDKEFVIEADISGYDPKNINIEIENDMLSIHGKMESEKEDEDKRYFRKEKTSGEFHRQIALPPYVESGKISCKAKNGNLLITAPKKTESQKKPIPIEEE